jgi:hypothetical protein
MASSKLILLSELLNLQAELKKNHASLERYLCKASIDAGDIGSEQKKKLQLNSELLQQAIQKLEIKIGERQFSVLERWMIMDPNSDRGDQQ